jgi:hypothetical protein
MRVETHEAAGAGGVLKRFYSERELSVYSGFSVRTLQAWRLRNQGPPFKRLGGSIRYDLQQFDAWVSACDGGGGGRQ